MKKILITGHTKGIGKCIAELFLKNNFEVVGIARTVLPEHNNLTQIQADLSDNIAVKKLCNKIGVDKFDYIFLNAGYNDIRPPESYSFDEIEKIIQLNFTTPSLLLRALLPQIINNKSWLFSIGSYSALHTARWNNFYGASKAGMQFLIQNMFEQYRKQGVRFTNIIPDIVKTDFYNHQQFEPSKNENTYIAPEQIAMLVWDLVNSNATYVPTEIVLRPQEFELIRKK